MGKTGAVAVVGGGIAGIQASLDLAEMGFKVYLVEKNPSIGGVMSQLDKTFPTNDCAMCLLSPKLVDSGRHPNIQLITHSELEKIEGEPGNFKVTVRRNPRYVDEEKCTGCGECVNNCPVRNIPYLAERKAEEIELEEEDREKITKIIDENKPEIESLVPILQDINAEYRYLPENMLRYVANRLDIPLSQVYNIATFYNTFSLIPRGKYTINVCLGTACYVKKGQKILQAFERDLNVKVGGTTEDLKFSLETVNCLGCCGQSPVATVNEDIYGYMKQAKVPEITKQHN